MSSYDQWLERPAVDALTDAELAEAGYDTDDEDDGPNPDDQRDAAREREWED